jgi:hypothetical protein
MGRNDALRAKQENEAFEKRRIGGETGGFEAFVCVLLGTFVVQARFAHGRNDDPVAREIDGVTVSLVHGGHAAPCEWAVEGVAGAFAFNDSNKVVCAFSKSADYRVGDFTVHFDVSLAGEREGVCRACRACVTEEFAEDVGEEIRKKGGFVEGVGSGPRR